MSVNYTIKIVCEPKFVDKLAFQNPFTQVIQALNIRINFKSQI